MSTADEYKAHRVRTTLRTMGRKCGKCSRFWDGRSIGGPGSIWCNAQHCYVHANDTAAGCPAFAGPPRNIPWPAEDEP
jgi:hypothetical protein